MSLLATARRLAAADAKALAWLLFSPRGWMGRINFLRGVALVFILNSLLVALALGFLAPITALFVLVITLYPTVCVAAKRLHGLGLSGWLQAPVRLLMGVGIGLMVLYQHHQQSALLASTCVLTFMLGLIGEAGMFIWLAVAPNRIVQAARAGVVD